MPDDLAAARSEMWRVAGWIAHNSSTASIAARPVTLIDSPKAGDRHLLFKFPLRTGYRPVRCGITHRHYSQYNGIRLRSLAHTVSQEAGRPTIEVGWIPSISLLSAQRPVRPHAAKTRHTPFRGPMRCRRSYLFQRFEFQRFLRARLFSTGL